MTLWQAGNFKDAYKEAMPNKKRKKEENKLGIFSTRTSEGILFQVESTPESLQDSLAFGVGPDGKEILFFMTVKDGGQAESGINTDYGQIRGSYYPEQALRKLWDYFQQVFESKEPYPEDIEEISNLDDPVEYLQSLTGARHLFEYARLILPGHVEAIMRDSLKPGSIHSRELNQATDSGSIRGRFKRSWSALVECVDELPTLSKRPHRPRMASYQIFHPRCQTWGTKTFD